MNGLSQYLASRTFPLIVQNGQASNAPANNGRSVFKMPVGPTFLSTYLYFTVAGAPASRAVIEAQVAWVRFFIDGDLAWEASGFEAAGMADFDKPGSVQSGILPVFFHNTLFEDPDNVKASAWGTVGLDSVSCEITWAASGVTITTVDAFHNIVQGEELGAHIRLQRLTRTFTLTGLDEIDNIPKKPDQRILGIHIPIPQQATAVLTNVELMADTSREVSAPPSIIHERYKEGLYGRQAQTNWAMHLDQTWRGLLSDTIPLTMSDFRLRLTWGTAAPNTYTILVRKYVVQPSKTVAA